MFLTNSTFRQATWQPDKSAAGAINGTTSLTADGNSFGTISGPGSTTHGTLSTYVGGATVPWKIIGMTVFSTGTTTAIGSLTQVILETTAPVSHFTTLSSNGTTALSGIAGVSTQGQSLNITSVAAVGLGVQSTLNPLLILTWQTVSRNITSATISIFDLAGTSSRLTLISASQTTSVWSSGPMFTSSVSQSSLTITWPIVPGVTASSPTATTLTSIVSATIAIPTSSGLSTTSTSSTSLSSLTTSTFATSTAFPNTSIVTTVTSTSIATVAIVSTSTSTTTWTRWSTSTSGNPFVTTYGVTTTVTTASTTTATRPFFSTVTSATPSWYGRTSEVGTCILVSGNASRDDLAAWLQATTGSVFGFQNFTFGTQTTLWPPAPVGTVGPQATILSSLATNVTSISVLWSSIYTTMEISTFTTSTTETAISLFTDSTHTGATSAAVPFAALAKTISTWSTSTATASGLLITPLNTILNVVSFTSNQAYSPVTEIRTVVVSILGSVASTITLLTYVPGYTTVSAAEGVGVLGATTLRNVITSIIIGPGLSLTTTTQTAPWFYDTSCPTVPVVGSGTTSTTEVTTILTLSSISGVGTTATCTVTSLVTTVSGGTIFTKNVWSAPTVIANGPVFVAPSVASFRPAPTMQGFSPWTAQSITYQDMLAPPEVAALLFAPFQTGPIGATNLRGGPITSTGWGVWGVQPQPSIVTSPFTATVTTTRTGATTSTTTTQASSIASISLYSLSSSASAGSSSTTFQVNFPTNLDESAADVFATTSSTTAGGSTSGTTSYAAALSFTNPVTSIFGESQGFTATSFGLTTLMTTIPITSFFGIGQTRTVGVFTTSGVNFPVTYTLNSTSSGAHTVYFPGVGGFPKISSAPASIFCCGAAVSLYGQSSTSWSSADPNFFLVVIGGSLTTSSAGTSDLGPGPFNVYSFPGEASLITGPCVSFTTDQNRNAPPASVGTAYWLTPDPVLLPNQVSALDTVVPG